MSRQIYAFDKRVWTRGKTVVREIETLVSCLGSPDTLVSDNGADVADTPVLKCSPEWASSGNILPL